MDYQKIYDNICLTAKSQNRVKGVGVYYEAHHILPKCMGGEGKVTQYKTHPNIVLLTTKEHFVVHRLLTKIYPNSKPLRMAWWAMCNQEGPNQERIYKPSGRVYEEARNGFIQFFSGENHPLYGKGYLQEGDKNHAYGKPQSDELKERKRIASTKSWENPKLREEQSKRVKGRKHSQETLEKMKQPKSEEHKKRIGLAHKGKKIEPQSKINMLIGRYGLDWYNQKYPNGLIDVRNV
jgi:hypothetical protein